MGIILNVIFSRLVVNMAVVSNGTKHHLKT